MKVAHAETIMCALKEAGILPKNCGDVKIHADLNGSGSPVRITYEVIVEEDILLHALRRAKSYDRLISEHSEITRR